jgi:hypothetical protein
MYKSVFENNYINQNIIDKYKIENNVICQGKILMKRYRFTSFLGLDLKVWKLKKFYIDNKFFYFWRVNGDFVLKKKLLKGLCCGKMISSKEYIPIDDDYNYSVKKYVYKFNVYKGQKKIIQFASIRLDSIEILYKKLYMVFQTLEKLN